MKVYEIQTFGIDELALVERPEPKPKAGQVLIKVKASSLNYRDLMMVTGRYNPKMSLPRVPNSDGSGEIVEVGEGVTRFNVGDRVAAAFMPKWIDGHATPAIAKSALGGIVDGMLSEYVAVDAEGVVKISEHLSYEEAATLPCAAVTAWNALVEVGRLKAGDTVLIQGTGGVSIFALQFAKMFGAKVIATSGSSEKIERLKELGADETINYKETLDWDKRVFELTDKTGVDLVVEVGGAGTLNKSLSAVRMGGTVIVIGALSGGSGEINTTMILMKGIRVQGIFVGSRKMFEDMNRAIALNKLKPVTDKTFSFDETREAFKYMESGRHFGKIVVSVP
jgi:NADPH:quinone reductase-like Zn-dependent oxidoreductase